MSACARRTITVGLAGPWRSAGCSTNERLVLPEHFRDDRPVYPAPASDRSSVRDTPAFAYERFISAMNFTSMPLGQASMHS